MEKNDFLKLNPMLLQEVFKPFDDKKYLFEIKFDGMRALIFIDKGNITIKSRRGIILNSIYPELLDIKNISKSTCVLDGEIVLFDKGKPSFSKLQERARLKNKHKIKFMQENYPVTFVCFDILYKDEDLINLPLINRKKILNKFKDTKFFVKSKYFEETGIKLFNLIKKENLEGIVAKKKDSVYSYGVRSYDWLKIKNFKEDEFYICGYESTKNDNILSALLGEKMGSKYFFVGKILYSYKNKDYEKVINSLVVKNYLENCDENAVFIKPLYRIRVNYMERTKNNMLRQPFIKKDDE